MIDFTGLTRADVLRVLYNAAETTGPMSMLAASVGPLGDMTPETAERMVQERSYFDYVNGRVLKVTLRKHTTVFDEALYDRDNGVGAAQHAIEGARR